MDRLITVNGEPVEVEDALGWAAFLDGPDLRAFAIEQSAVAQAARARGLEASAEEVRELFVEMRYLKRLESGEALRKWMADNAVTQDAMAEACNQIVLRRKLRESIDAAEIERHYAENRPAYDRAEIYRITVEDADLAQEIKSLVLEEDESFCLLAIEHSTDGATAPMGGYAGVVERGDLPGETEAMVFGSTAGDVVGPVRAEGGWDLLLIHSIGTRTLDTVAAEIRDAIFSDLIAAAVSRARIEGG